MLNKFFKNNLASILLIGLCQIKGQMKKGNKKRLKFMIFGFVAVSFLSIFYLMADTNPRNSHKYPLEVNFLNNGNILSKSYSIVPEYKQTMEKVLISLAKGNKTLEYHHDILANLPSYTQVIILVPDSNLKEIERQYREKSYHKKMILVPYKSRPQNGASYYVVFPENDKLVELDMDSSQVTHGQGTLWARDLFVAVRQSNNRPLLLVPDIHKYFISYGDKSDLKVINDNSYLKSLVSFKMDLVRSPLTFKGGNIQFDIFENKKIIFVGVNALLSTRIVWKSTMGSTPSDEKLVKMIKEFFHADEVVVIGKNSIQPLSLMFHLDQTLVFLEEGVVGITHIVGQKEYASMYTDEVREVELFLKKARTTLVKRGYQILNIDTSVKNIVTHEQYVNGIPYVDKRNREKVLLMPIFSSDQTEFDRRLIRRNRKTFESVGYRVIYIPTNAGKLNGGIHCLINVII